MSFLEEFHHLKIQLEDIISATNNFSPNKLIGRGGFGSVYKGELSIRERKTMLAFKRLDSRSGQGNTEFWKEIFMLSKYRHGNLVSLLHFCNDADEMILVYEYASRGSLNHYLGDTSLTWTERLQICLGAARGLNYLHDPVKTQQRVLHRDIKSSNILLDENWIAKVSDFGLSKVGPANQSQTYIVSNVVGTLGYCDPLYWEIGVLSKESDVYSFGVVLFEVLCGRLCCEYRNGELTGILVSTWKKCFDEKRLDDVICHALKEQIDSDSLVTFSTIAYRCLNRDHKKRPTMVEIVKELEVALKQQNIYEVNVSTLEVSLSDKSLKEHLLPSKRILDDGGKTRLSINENGKIRELVSALSCISGSGFELHTEKDSRFSHVLKGVIYNDFEVEVSTQCLSPHVTYTINLIFRHSDMDLGTHIPFKYKLDEERHYFNSCIVHTREDGWLMTELYQFTSYQREHDFRIEFSKPFQSFLGLWYLLEGIEFQPAEFKTRENLEDKNKVDMQLMLNLETNWEENMPFYYTTLIKLSKDSVDWTTKKDLYFLLRKGILVNNGKKLFSISKTMKKRFMISAREFLLEGEWIWRSIPESRFEVVAESRDTDNFSALFLEKFNLLSPQTTYSCHLIYKLPKRYFLLEGLVVLLITYSHSLPGYPRFIYLITPSHTPIIGPMVNQKYYSPSDTRKIKGHPKLRKDGWMEFQLCEVSTNTTGSIWMHIRFRSYEDVNFVGLVVQGIEFRAL